MSKVLDQLSQRRAELGISQREMSRRLGVSRSLVWMWETGQAEPPPARIEQYAREVGLEFDQVLREPAPGGEVDLTPAQQAALEDVARYIGDVPDEKVPVLLAVLNGLRRSS